MMDLTRLLVAVITLTLVGLGVILAGATVYMLAWHLAR